MKKLKMSKNIKFGLGLGFIALLSGCSFRPDMPEVQTNVQMRYEFEQYNLNDKWWQEFNDEKLNELILSALANNSDLLIALNNLERARIQMNLSKIEFLPNSTLSGASTKNKANANENSSHSLSGSASWEIDLWGRVRNSARAGIASFKASQYDYENAKLSIITSVANTYFTLVSLQNQEQILKDSLASYEETLSYRKAEYESGNVDELVYSQAKASVDDAKSQLVSLQDSLISTRTALALLAGKDTSFILNGDLSKVIECDESKITEEATHSWYKNDSALHPYDGQTEPNYTGLKDEKTLNAKGQMQNSKVFDQAGKYSWIKAPRYNGLPMQVGPLANIVVNYAKNNPYVVPVVDKFLKDTSLPLNAVLSTLGRTACRMIEAKIIANNTLKAFNNLVENLKVDDETCAPYVIDKNKEYKGRYIGHVPRGTLSHWCRIENGVIKNWQAVVPSTWNASPKDASGQMGSYEACLIGLKIADLKQPLEIIRKIHSYDPCIACAVHVMDTKGAKISEYKVNPNLC